MSTCGPAVGILRRFEENLMLFGIHSLLFNETFTEKDLPLLDKCKGLGFDAVELIPFDPDHFPAKEPVAIIPQPMIPIDRPACPSRFLP